MKKTMMIILMLISVRVMAQLPPPQDSMYFKITKIHNAEDYFRVDGYDVKTKLGYWFDCHCKYRSKAKEGDTIFIPKPELIEKKPTRRFLFSMNKQLEQVKQWHEKYCVPVLTFSQLPANDRINLRMKLIDEEAFELGVALKECMFDPKGIGKVQLLCNVLKEASDVIYVVNGTLLEFGLHNSFDAAFDEVHASNMTKTLGNNREDGKVLKGDLYVPPNLKKLFV